MNVESYTGNVNLNLKSGMDGGVEGSVFNLFDGAVAKWSIGKGTSNEFYVWSAVSGDRPLEIVSSGVSDSDIRLIGNVGIGTPTFGTNAAGTLAMANGTAPTGDVANQFAMYAADLAAGNSIPYFRTENGTVIGLNQSLLTTDRPTFAGLTETADIILMQQVYS